MHAILNLSRTNAREFELKRGRATPGPFCFRAEGPKGRRAEGRLGSIGERLRADCVTPAHPHTSTNAARDPSAPSALRSDPQRAKAASGTPQRAKAASGTPQRPAAPRSGQRHPAAASSGQRHPAAPRGTPRPRRRFRRRRRFGRAPRRRCRRCRPATPGSVGTLPPGPRFRPPTSPRAHRWQPKAPVCPKSEQQLPKRAATAQKVGNRGVGYRANRAHSRRTTRNHYRQGPPVAGASLLPLGPGRRGDR
jgi:hypothetical protein